ncbi:MAG: transporter substrate-binding domain-containing protein [Candidatus Dormibacteria bacterium]
MALAVGATLVAAGCGGGADSGSGSSTAVCPVDAAAPAHRTAPPPRSSLLTAGTLTFGSDISYPPQEFHPDGCGARTVDGFDIDVARALAARMGLKFAVVDTKLDAIIPALQAKKFDAVVSAVTINDERKKVVNMVPYFVAGESFVVTSGSSRNPLEIKDLCGLKVAVEKGTVEESDAADANDATRNGPCAGKPIQFKDFSFDKDTEALVALKKGTVDVHFTDSPVAGYEVLMKSGYRISNKAPLNSAPEGIASRKDDDAMTTALTAAFAAIRSDGSYKKLLDKWRVADGDIARAP